MPGYSHLSGMGQKRISGWLPAQPLILVTSQSAPGLFHGKPCAGQDARQMPRICLFLAVNSSSVSKPCAFIAESF
jgi:hypothetical protein